MCNIVLHWGLKSFFKVQRGPVDFINLINNTWCRIENVAVSVQFPQRLQWAHHTVGKNNHYLLFIRDKEICFNSKV